MCPTCSRDSRASWSTCSRVSHDACPTCFLASCAWSPLCCCYSHALCTTCSRASRAPCFTYPRVSHASCLFCPCAIRALSSTYCRASRALVFCSRALMFCSLRPSCANITFSALMFLRFKWLFHIYILLMSFSGKIYYSQNKNNIKVIIWSDGQQ